ncbi:FecR family protein [Croceicoccus bisphenolivorans]|uniref:FecR family protein n=1 Tax=Croceicoccus bisphenolivorans TaxID=1783232 RepID=UPI001C12B3AE|nr:FecR domain-containing protein [Croceicoccus bisphenolivorans]
MHRQGEGEAETDVAGTPQHVPPAIGHLEAMPQIVLNRSSASPEALCRVWEDAASLGRHPRYAELLGPPTLRERFVAWTRRIGGIMAGPPVARDRPRFAMAALAALFVLGSVWMLRPASPVFETQIAEVREIPLKDGSLVTLGGHSALNVAFSPSERTVQLTRGEAFFSVSPDRNRPFVVLVGGQRIRVVGTKFNVNFDGKRVHVSVMEGVVQVAPDTAGEHPENPQPEPGAQGYVTLVAGQKLSAGSSGQARPEPLGGEAGTWRSGHLDYHDAALGQIIADARRYYPHPIEIASPALASEHLTTSFSASQVDQMLDTLPDILPLTVDREADGSVTLRRRSAVSK